MLYTLVVHVVQKDKYTSYSYKQQRHLRTVGGDTGGGVQEDVYGEKVNAKTQQPTQVNNR